MKFTLAIFFVACAVPALAQNGITNTRDGNGNLIRNTGMNPVRGSSQSTLNNTNGAVTNTLGPTAPINSRLNKVPGR
jgi:hypothetical protein